MNIDKRDRKNYLHDWYVQNRDRVLRKGKKYYQEHKKERLTYRKTRKERDNLLRMARRTKNPETFRDKESLWLHKNSKRIWKKRKEEQQERYLYYQSESLLSAKNHRQKWTESEMQFLIENYKNKTILEIASELSRTWASVSGKLCRMELIKLPRRIDNLLEKDKTGPKQA